MRTKNIMIVGVGGQGTLLASKLLGRLLLEKGYDVKVSEVHGMSQRGGSVVTYVRYGDKVYSPIIDKGEADIIISFELLEAARWTEFLKPDGTIVTNTQEINPMPVIIGAAEYPTELVKKSWLSVLILTQLTLFHLPRRQELPKRSTLFLWADFQSILTLQQRNGWQRLKRAFRLSSLR